MKKIALLLLAGLSCFTSYAQLKSEPVILSGAIANPNSDSLVIMKDFRTSLFTINVNKDGTFEDTLTLNKGYYYLFDGEEQSRFYVTPGDNLHITLNTNEFDETITYRGTGSVFNNYLAKRVLLRESYDNLNQMPYYLKLDETSFVSLVDSLYDLNMALLSQFDLPSDLYFIEKNAAKYERLRKLCEYEPLKRYFTGQDSFRVSKNYPDQYKGLDLGDEKLIDVPDYLEVASSYISDKTRAAYKKSPSQDPFDLYLNQVKKHTKSPEVCDALAHFHARMQLSSVRNLDSSYTHLMTLITNDDHKKEFEDRYTKLKRIDKGQPSPSFSFEDSSARKFTLQDFKGKYVYIDVWATWCGPCIKEIPHLLELEKEMEGKNIAFVSICQNDDRQRWLKYLGSHEMSGTQLYAERGDNAFFDSYLIRGIPHFILLDPEGNIVYSDALRPSNPSFHKELNELLGSK